ncbi:uncharacterized protein BDZ99DRAFT_550946 [Mytilinidion resinicola]|uniref:Uncharacterized protein n=1 Tax=Mytilinidion resinicola TaxID=574789 RepID=A0A6A6Y496_9PEZI|nr:uncharacterized protein BDZ99DRAFT_550946 [Mytilinidion resinicola]KAF2802617.1 hypothetical protein BDZ99DRAFT_550946 [Mytilinidion resinicola]
MYMEAPCLLPAVIAVGDCHNPTETTKTSAISEAVTSRELCGHQWQPHLRQQSAIYHVRKSLIHSKSNKSRGGQPLGSGNPLPEDVDPGHDGHGVSPRRTYSLPRRPRVLEVRSTATYLRAMAAEWQKQIEDC